MRPLHVLRLAPLLVATPLFGCGDARDPSFIFEEPPSGLEATPPWLAFICTEPGCQGAQTSTVTVVGDRALAIRRIILSEPEHPEFRIESSRKPPFVLSPTDNLPIFVRYRPQGDPSLSDPSIRVAFTDASPEESEDRVEAGEIEIPLIRRLIGEARLEIEPAVIDFGAVPLGQSRTATVRIRNIGFGNVGLGLAEVTIQPATELAISPAPSLISAGETAEMQVSWRPSLEQFLDGRLTLTPTGLGPSTSVEIIGTSLPGPRLSLSPTDEIRFGEVEVGAIATQRVVVSNRGSEPLRLEALRWPGVTNAARLEGQWPTGDLPLSLAPLSSVDLRVELTALLPAILGGHLELQSNDVDQPVAQVPLSGVLTRPTLSVSPSELDFGSVPQGWTRTALIEISNAGVGALRLRNVSLVLGSSELFRLRMRPDLPVRLDQMERLSLEIEFRSEAAASFTGSLALESNDPDRPFFEVPIRALGASCEEGCPIANGTPDCADGVCAVGRCNDGFHDADLNPANGCECREPDRRGDPGGFCSESVYLGSLNDDGASVSFTGIVPSVDDEDLIRVHARDSTQLFSDDYDVRMELQTTDPAVEMCVYRKNTGSHRNECFFENERCGLTTYRRDGGLGRDDAADYIVRVRRRPGAAPTCTSYTIFVRNG